MCQFCGRVDVLEIFVRFWKKGSFHWLGIARAFEKFAIFTLKLISLYGHTFHSTGASEQHIGYTRATIQSVKPLSGHLYAHQPTRSIFPHFSQKSPNFHQNVLHAAHHQHFRHRFDRKFPIFIVDEHKITFDLFLYLADRNIQR